MAERGFAALARGVQSNDPVSLADLYALVTVGLRRLAESRVGHSEALDIVHDAFVAVVQALASGSLRQVEHLPQYIYRVGRNLVSDRLRERGIERNATYSGCQWGIAEPCTSPTDNPECLCEKNEQNAILNRALNSLSLKDQDMLRRSLLLCQTEVEIRAVLGITTVQFRLRKNRAKVRLVNEGRKLQLPRIRRIFIKCPVDSRDQRHN
jgi:RNA polymerase sigma factor (sigma-70 family)